MQPEFPGDCTIAQALPMFYEQYGLSADGGASEPTVKIIIYKKFCFYLPNIAARKKAVLKHDIHHIVTGYKSDFKGESEIAAWEVSTGCTHYWVGWALDLSGMALGVLYNLPGVFRAFVRGRRTKNLYHDTIPDQAALNMTVNELREKLGLDTEEGKRATIKEILSFIGWNICGGIYTLLSAIFLPPIIIYSIVVAAKKRTGKGKGLQSVS